MHDVYLLYNVGLYAIVGIKNVATAGKTKQNRLFNGETINTIARFVTPIVLNLH